MPRVWLEDQRTSPLKHIVWKCLYIRCYLHNSFPSCFPSLWNVVVRHTVLSMAGHANDSTRVKIEHKNDLHNDLFAHWWQNGLKIDQRIRKHDIHFCSPPLLLCDFVVQYNMNDAYILFNIWNGAWKPSILSGVRRAQGLIVCDIIINSRHSTVSQLT